MLKFENCLNPQIELKKSSDFQIVQIQKKSNPKNCANLKKNQIPKNSRKN
jgi:hypothetical protein